MYAGHCNAIRNCTCSVLRVVCGGRKSSDAFDGELFAWTFSFAYLGHPHVHEGTMAAWQCTLQIAVYRN